MKPFHLKLIKLGAIQTLLMALYHFYLPFQFGWSQFIPEGIASIKWALFALNNYFSFNLLVLCLTLIYYIRSKKLDKIKLLSFITACFWVFSAIYQWIESLPLPTSFNWVGYLLPFLAFFNSLLFMVPLIASRGKIETQTKTNKN